MAENQVKVRPALTDLKVGGEITFPIAKTKSVRDSVEIHMISF